MLGSFDVDLHTNSKCSARKRASVAISCRSSHKITGLIYQEIILIFYPLAFVLNNKI